MSKKIRFKNCRPDTLMGYLKSIGVYRLIVGQMDPEAKICWEGRTLVIDTKLAPEQIVEFLVKEYIPTPIVVPWSGKDFFKVPEIMSESSYKKPPTGGELIKSFLSIDSSRMAEYRTTLNRVLNLIEELNLSDADIKSSASGGSKQKSNFVNRLRSILPDRVIPFIDAALIPREERPVMNSVLGSGGGSDGNLNFGSNYMQSLWLILPDFADQKKLSGKLKRFDTKSSCLFSLFGEETANLIGVPDDTPGLFAPGGVGGPNAFRGFEADSLRNPWDYVLCLEGISLLAGSLSRRQGSDLSDRASFPFTVGVSAGMKTLELSESSSAQVSNRELWLPVWDRGISNIELQGIFNEGRAEVGRNSASNGTEFARAVASLGVDRGISGFYRFAIVRGRVGGDNYHTAVPVEFWKVPKNPDININIFEELDPWLERLRWNASEDSGAKRFGRHLKNIERAIQRYAKLRQKSGLVKLMCLIGRAEKNFSRAINNSPVAPLNDLTPQWLKVGYDGSAEYRIAAALGSIYDSEIGPIRRNMEPVNWGKKSCWVSDWDGGNKSSVVWTERSLYENLAAILKRRQTQAKQEDLDYLPIRSIIQASLNDIERFLKGELDENKITDLFWFFATLRWNEFDRQKNIPDEWDFAIKRAVSPAFSRIYSLFKLLHLPGDLKSKNGWWILTSPGNADYCLPFEPRIIRNLETGDFNEAIRLANHRLRASGYFLKGQAHSRQRSAPDFLLGDVSPESLLGGLLIPIYWEKHGVTTLAKFILEEPDKKTKLMKEA